MSIVLIGCASQATTITHAYHPVFAPFFCPLEAGLCVAEIGHMETKMAEQDLLAQSCLKSHVMVMSECAGTTGRLLTTEWALVVHMICTFSLGSCHVSDLITPNVWVYACMCVCVRSCVHMHVCMCVYMCVCMCMCVYLFAYVFVCVCVCA